MEAHVSDEMYALVQMQAVSKANRYEFQRNPYNFPCNVKGYFIDQFDVPKKLNHVVCVDSDLKLFSGSWEKYAVNLNIDTLHQRCSTKTS